MQIVEALKNLGSGAQADAELRRIERQGKRAREPEDASLASPLKHPKLEPHSGPTSAPVPPPRQQHQAVKLEPTAGVAPAAAVVSGDPRRVKREPAVVKPEGAAAAPLQAGVLANQQRYEQLQQHAAQHQRQQQQPAKPLRQVWSSWLSQVAAGWLPYTCRHHYTAATCI